MPPGAVTAARAVERLDAGVVELQEHRILRHRGQAVRVDGAKQPDGIVGRRAPQVVVEGPEDLARVLIPHPPQDRSPAPASGAGAQEYRSNVKMPCPAADRTGSFRHTQASHQKNLRQFSRFFPGVGGIPPRRSCICCDSSCSSSSVSSRGRFPSAHAQSRTKSKPPRRRRRAPASSHFRQASSCAMWNAARWIRRAS